MFAFLKRLFPPEPPRMDEPAREMLGELLEVRRRLEAVEDRQGDLHERFNRFQNREGMRKARDSRDLQAEAAEILARTAQDAPQAVPGGSGKPDLSGALLARRRSH